MPLAITAFQGVAGKASHFNIGEKMKRNLAMLAAVLVLTAIAASAAPSSGYHVIKKVAVPGTGSWDYVTVDDANRRVYIAHATQVEVLDADTAEFVGTIPNTPGAHGVAVVLDLGRGFITAGKADSVIIFDLKTLKPLGEIKVGKKPDAIIYDPATKHLFVMNGESDSASVINPADGKVVGTIDLGGGPEFAAADGKGNVYINLEEKAETLHIDANSLKILHRWPLAPGKTATAMAFDPQNRRLFAGCRGGQLMVVLDADSGKTITTAPIGERVDAAAFDPATKLVFMSTGGGTTSVFHQDSVDKYTLVDTLTTNPGSKTMGLDPKTHHLFVPANLGGQFTILVFGQ
jgi:YVTN family beta-propeller protein